MTCGVALSLTRAAQLGVGVKVGLQGRNYEGDRSRRRDDGRCEPVEEANEVVLLVAVELVLGKADRVGRDKTSTLEQGQNGLDVLHVGIGGHGDAVGQYFEDGRSGQGRAVHQVERDRACMTKVLRRAAVVCQRSNTKSAGVGLVSTKAESAAA